MEALRFFAILSIALVCGGCAGRPPMASRTNDFLSDALTHPEKVGETEVQSRYWARGNFLVRFITNVNEQNKSQLPIIYVHGLGGSLHDYLDLIKTLHPAKTSRPYYAIDLPPFGRSVLQGSGLSIKDYAETLQEFIAMLGVPKVNLVCHSMGGQVCIEFALTHPEEIQLLTLISPAGTYDKTAYVSKTVKNLAGINVGSVEEPGGKSIADLAWYNQSFSRRMITDNPVMLIAVESFRENFRERMNKLKTKTLIIWGRDDQVFSFENGFYLKENIENSTLYLIDGAQHTPMKTHATIIAKLIQERL